MRGDNAKQDDVHTNAIQITQHKENNGTLANAKAQIPEFIAS